MVERLEFADYHRTFIGYHGTTAEVADELVAGAPFLPSSRDDDWLGTGVYFWEYAPRQAWWWAKEFKKVSSAAVVGAMIRLGNCFDVLDPQNIQVLRSVKERLSAGVEAAGAMMPRNTRQRRQLDCAVFNLLYQQSEKADTPIDSARAVYVPTDHRQRIWKGSWIYESAHIQVNIRQAKNILAVWHVQPDGRYGKKAHSKIDGD